MSTHASKEPLLPAHRSDTLITAMPMLIMMAGITFGSAGLGAAVAIHISLSTGADPRLVRTKAVDLRETNRGPRHGSLTKGQVDEQFEVGAPPQSTNILIAYHSRSNWTKTLASYVQEGALSAGASVESRLRVVTDVSCADLRWADGIALGTPVYWGTLAAPVKKLIDDVQDKCFGFPVAELEFKVGAAFATGGHESSGKDGALLAIHAFFHSVQMVVVGGENYGSCHMGACATHFPDDAVATGITTSVFGTSGAEDGTALGKRIAQVASAVRHARLPR